MERLAVKTESKLYEILIGSGLYNRLPEIFYNQYSGRKLALITDNNVFTLYGRFLAESLKQKGFFLVPVVFEAGEPSKTLATLTQIYDALANNAFTRSDMVIALGGGVTGDMAGLAAATFLRGMKYIQIPTTLLAMVDSSIGGKVAVDMPQGKNLIGTFYQPDGVYTDPKLLETLSNAQFSDGLAELLKHGIIKDVNLFNRLLDDANAGCNSYEGLSEKLDRYVFESCEIKRKVVEEDEFDNGIRQLLNFGHTVGHAIERVQNYSGYSHGEAISVGMVIMTYLTEQMNLTKQGEAQRLKNALCKLGLPVELPSLNIKDLVNAISLDKKNRSGKITIAYIEEIGRGMLQEVNLDQMEDSLYGILKDFIQTS